MRFARLVSLAAVALLVVTAHASSAAVTVPTNLHGFLLRADEPQAAAFHRTPSFAWSPVPGAIRYEFQLSTSSTFRDNGILYRNNQLQTPVEAPPLTLPWITGSPHGLYARVRAVLASATTEWSAPYGFDITPPPAPAPLPSYPGVLRWTPTEGATGYQVWLGDVPKFETVRTNVLDEREYYTFHQAQSWIGTIRWRIRALRSDTFNYRINGVPVAQYGPWSPVYSSTNPAMTSGKITLSGTVSDVFSDGSSGSDAHKTMPAFLWTGNQTDAGTPVELYRVYVYTDKQCLNRVYTSAVVGSPAYAPRPYGPLNLPATASGITAARHGYLQDGAQTNQMSADGDKADTTESLPQATPTTTIPGDVPSATGTTPPIGSTPADPVAGSGSSGSSGSGGSSGISVSGKLGAPVDLWDTDWPKAGYYWTVIPVKAVVLGAASSSVAAPGASKGSTVVPVADSSEFAVGVTVTVGTAPGSDTGTVTAVDGGTITLSGPLGFGHAPGEPVVALGGSAVIYQDLELAQDVCAAGRVQRFGISSEPSLTTAQAPFATGLSASGRLTSASQTPAFYGQPLIAWTPALGAYLYQVQWSQTKYPFVAENDPRTKTKGYLTFSNSAVLPLGPGTWYYRVRGFDWALPTGVQQMGWSDPEKLVVTKPIFKITTSTTKKKKFNVVGKSK
jgi:hypothetical protein